MTENKDYKILNVLGTNYKTLFTSKYEKRQPWEKDDPKKIKNPIPGTVLEIYVKEGDSVDEGQDLIDLEAMKMINKITAPFAGKVKGVYVHPGKVLNKGTVVVEFE